MRIRLPTLAALLLLAGCASPALKIDTRYDSAVQDSRVQFLILHYTVADFDESVDILFMYRQRSEDTACAIAFGVRGIIIRGVIGKKSF